MKRKYLDDLGIIFPYSHLKEDDPRDAGWQEEKEEYGFDERETWNLDFFIAALLYERLMMYKEFAGIDLDFHKRPYKDEILTQRQAIDRMIDGFKSNIIQGKPYDELRYKKIDEAYDLLSIWHSALWW